jgi:hypothetical protein
VIFSSSSITSRLGPTGPLRESWSSQLVIFSPCQCLRLVGGNPAASAQILLNPDSSVRADFFHLATNPSTNVWKRRIHVSLHLWVEPNKGVYLFVAVAIGLLQSVQSNTRPCWQKSDRLVSLTACIGSFWLGLPAVSVCLCDWSGLVWSGLLRCDRTVASVHSPHAVQALDGAV